ncbi:phosphatidate cytidylyltransferase [Breoghania sp.]|uniref:phosphatidate cytidylyltransferase n=1 Tax=Breoghania sp. TaxID=2065378 RepID=UPI0029C9FE74|nr:phosphatidate cytidylyltransferase [Breoghania sp.]
MNGEPEPDLKAGKPAQAGKSAGRSNLYLRVASALVLAPVFLALVWYGGAPFVIVLSICSLLILNEWTRITGAALSTSIVGGAGLVVACGTVWWGSDLTAIGVVIVVGAGIRLWERVAGRTPWSAAGVLYAGLPTVALAELRLGEHGLWAVAMILALTWATDIAAYFTGRALGGPKLWPSVSPNKTWSGAIGGAVGGALAASIVALVSGIGSPVAIAVLAMVFSVASQLGDLGESALKRRFGVKDSGNLIPGHGGIMDRVDGLVTATFAAYVVGLIASGGADSSLGLALF